VSDLMSHKSARGNLVSGFGASMWWNAISWLHENSTSPINL